MKIEQSIEIHAPPDEVFALMQDYGRRLDWDPFLRSAVLLDGASCPAVGVRSRCVTWWGMRMDTEYVVWSPPVVAAVTMTRGPWLLRSFAGSWRFAAISDGSTKVTFQYNLTTRPKTLEPFVVWLFRREMNKRLTNLKLVLQAKSRKKSRD